MSESDLLELSREDLLVLVRDLLRVNQEQQARIVHLEEQLAQRRSGTPPPSAPRQPPDFVKPNRPKGEKKPRKPRGRGYARKREEPTRVVDHAPEHCSVCGRKLSGGWVHASRQIIDIPQAPVEVVEHRFLARHCGVCERREFSRPDLSEEVVGQGRVGVGLMSLIGYLDTVCRMPIATIQRLLEELYGLKLSQGEIVRVQHTLAQAGQSTYEGLLEEVRASEVVNADETGGREDGHNGYVWSLSTADVRFYHRDASRAASVVQELLGHDPRVYQARTAGQVREAQAESAAEGAGERTAFSGVLVSDFFSGYGWYLGPHQCCLVHLDRDLDALKEQHEKDPAVCAWVEAVLGLVERAKGYVREHPDVAPAERCQQRQAFEQEAQDLARPYCASALPQKVLAKRLIKHLHQLFVFVENPKVPADNNAAERAVRPFVVIRKVSGGTRSPQGSHTQSVLLSLFGTWLLRGQHLLAACQQMLVGGAAPAPG